MTTVEASLSTVASAIITANARSFPRMVDKVRTMVADPACSAQVLTSVILSDPMMTAVLISRCNTAAGESHEGIFKVSGGVVFLGLASLNGLSQEIEGIEDDLRSRLGPCWSAANGCGAMTRILAKHCGNPPEIRDDETLYVHGMLSLLGVIYAVQCFPQAYTTLSNSVAEDKAPCQRLNNEFLA